MEPTQIDQDLANFLGVEDIKFGCFMRGIIMICIDENNTERNKEFGRYIEEYKNLHNATLEQKHFEMNEQIRIMDENWKLKEEYYFKHTSMKKHQIITELGTVDQDDKEKMKKCKEMVDNHLETTGSASSDELPWEKETNSSTCSDEFNQNENFAKRYQIYNKSSHPTKVNTPHSTNNNSQMQERTEYGNSQYSRNQSITMAITADHDMGENSIKSKESMHKPKTANDLKYFAGLFTHQMKGTQAQDDKMITEFLNNNKLLEFHVNTLGRTIKNGNEYTYVGFFTETAKNKFLEDTRISEAIGKFRNLEWLNKIDTTILISVTGIEKSMNIEDVITQLENKFGKMERITHQNELNGKINMKVLMNIKCTDDELLNTWGIFINGKMIRTEPLNYKNHVTKQRGKIIASVIDIPNHINDTEFTPIFRQTEEITEDFKAKCTIKEDMKITQDVLYVKGTITKQEIAISTTATTTKDRETAETTEEKIGTITIVTATEGHMTTKEISRHPEDRTTTTTVTADTTDTEKIGTMITEEDNLTMIAMKMEDMKIEDIRVKDTNKIDTTIIENKTRATKETIVTMAISEEIEDTITETGTKEIDTMEDVEWTSASKITSNKRKKEGREEGEEVV
ncbi:uncharacterized protein OCT59_028700 [Rhizophagus irregularis]|uniref:uncharacterized protein n=1 Tax=Rhizophagus irregularis TaxID=588596 RepID=UPI00333421E4|nr:hypothetical protein OCT59_028700 [Rhizophagus irregularis]